MLVRPTRVFPGSVFFFRGSALQHIWPILLMITLLSVGYTWAIHRAALEPLTLTVLPFSLIGLALSIFLGFRNNACYERWWEGRKLWGALINTTRTFARQSLTLVDPEDSDAASVAHRRVLVLRTIAFTHALRLHLRTQLDRVGELEPFLGPEEVERLRSETNVPNAIIHRTGELAVEAYNKGWVDTLHLPVLDDSLRRLTDIQGGCERIKNTPVPLSYTILTHRIVATYCVALPFGIIDTVGVLTPLVVAFVSFAFLGLDSVGSQIEDPFEEDPNDLPLHALSVMIERNLKQRLGPDEILPEPIREAGHILL